jgi:putative DNA primase/helicase
MEVQSVSHSITVKRRRGKSAVAAVPECEKSLVAALLDELLSDPAATQEMVKQCDEAWLTIPAAADVLQAVAASCVLPAPKAADVLSAIRSRQKEIGQPGVDAAQSLFADCMAALSKTPQAYRLGLRRFAGEVEAAYRKRRLSDCARALAAKADEGAIDESDLDLVSQEVERLRDVLTNRARPQHRLVLVRASEIEVSAVNWLWPQRIVGDGLTIITGPVGISKSLISVDVAARVTTGGKWPDGTGHAQQGSVILFGAEDDAGKIVVPRLTAAGAELSRVHVCQGTMAGDDDDTQPAAVILEHHIGQLRAALDDVADCRLIVFDPLPDYIAGDENNSAEVRAALVPLARLAQERNVAVVAVLHQNKKNDLTTVQRIAGSGAFAQIARVVLAIGTHPDDADKDTGKRRVMLVSKNNYGERDIGQAYEIESRSNGQPGLVWQAGTVTMDADEIARRPTGGREHEDRRSDAVDALRDLLAAGEQNAGTLMERLQDAGLGRRQIDHAATTLNVIKTKHRDGWYWRLPAKAAREAQVPLPDPAFAAFTMQDS